MPRVWTAASTTPMWAGRAAGCGRRVATGHRGSRKVARAPCRSPSISSFAPTRSRIEIAAALAMTQKEGHCEERSNEAIRPFRQLPVGNLRQAGLVADLVDDLQYALAIRPVLHAELLHQPAVVDQVIAGNRLAAGCLVEGDL